MHCLVDAMQYNAIQFVIIPITNIHLHSWAIVVVHPIALSKHEAQTIPRQKRHKYTRTASMLL